MLILFGIGFAYRNLRYANSPLKQYFMPALAAKLFGALVFVVVYVYYYRAGDSIGYYRGGRLIYRAFDADWHLAWKLLWVQAKEVDPEIEFYTSRMPYFHNDEGLLMHKLCGFTAIFCSNSYFLISLIFSFFSFTGIWKLYTTMVEHKPHLYKEFSWVVLFIPSAIFWGSGILKDTICIGSLGWLFYAFSNLVSFKKIIRSLIVGAIAFQLILQLKAYILLSFIPAAMFWSYLKLLKQIRVPLFKFIVGAVMISGFIIGGLFTVSLIATVSQKYAVDRLSKMAKGFQEYHSYLDESGEAGSGYHLDVGDFSTFSMLKVMPAAVNVTLFRPYVWEARSPFMMASAFESMIMFVFVFRIFRKYGLRFCLARFGDPDVAMFMIFTLILAFSIGVTAFNFGALVRFKIPIIPFFLCGILIIRDFGRQKVAKEAMLRQRRLAKRAELAMKTSPNTL